MGKLLKHTLRKFKRQVAVYWKRLKAQAELDEVYESYEKAIASAKKLDERRMLEAEQSSECQEYEEEIASIDSFELTRRANHYHLAVSDFPLPPDESNHWIQGNYGTWYLHQKTYRELAKAVEAAEHERTKHNLERRDFWLKAFTAIFAALAAVASVITLIRKW